MPTYTALTTLPGKDPAEALGLAMERLSPEPTGIGVFEMEDGSGLWEIGGYFTDAPDQTALDILAAAFGAKPFTVSEVPDVDWVAKVRRELAPVKAGRFYVYGSHDAETVPDTAVPLLIEASMAFGTGHHGTTLGCLKAFDTLLTNGYMPGPVADIGCGTAVLAMAAARVRTAPTFASDIDPVAIEVAEANVAANDMHGQVTCFTATGFDDSRLNSAAPFDIIFANILKSPLLALGPDIFDHLAPGGFVILSGILTSQAEEVSTAYSQIGFNPVDRLDIVDWSTLTMGRADL